MKLGVQGFQSLKRVVMEWNPGDITLVVGKNNVGKSAVSRAVESFIVNHTSAKDFINADVGFARVKIKDDKVYEWKRTEGTASYFIDGEEKRKLNRLPLIEVDPSCGFLVEKGEGDTFIPSIVREGEILFPFNVTPSNAFKLFSRFMATPKIGVLLKEIKVMIKDDKESLERVRGSIDTYDTELSKVKTLLQNAPDKVELEQIKERLGELALKKQRYARILPEFLSGIERKEELIKEINKTRKSIASYSKLVVKVDKLELLWNEVQGFKGRVESLEAEVNRRSTLEVKRGVLRRYTQEVCPPDMLDRMEGYLLIRGKWEVLSVEKERLEKERSNAQERLAYFKVEMSKFDTCPLCGQELKGGC